MKRSALLAASIATLVIGGAAIHSTAIPLLPSNPLVRSMSRPSNLPKTLESAIAQDLRHFLDLPPEPAFLPIVKQVEPATWQGCLPTPGAPGSDGSCQTATHSGWKVKLEVPGETQAKGQIWTYYASQTDGTFFWDGPESVNSTVKAAIAQRLHIAPKDLQIAAAEPMFAACPTRADCLPGHKLSWRIATNDGRMFHLDLQGNEVKRGLEAQRSEAGLPLTLKNAVMRDIADRDRILTANLKVESIKATTWNWCGGGGGEGPTPPEMGTCPNITQSGWQMVVRSGPIRYVYYLQEGMERVEPDGMQSIPENAIAQIKEDLARRDKSTLNNARIHRVSPQFFDGCMNVKPADSSCRRSVQAGWAVMVVGGNSTVNNAWYYVIDLYGTRPILTQTGTWHPVP